MTIPNAVSDTNLANNNATDSDTIKFRADLKVTVTDGKTEVTAGQKDTHTIVVTNFGPSDATGGSSKRQFPGQLYWSDLYCDAEWGATGFTASGSSNIDDAVNLPSGSKITYKAKAPSAPQLPEPFPTRRL